VPISVDERRREVLRLHEQGLTQPAIAERFGCHAFTVRRDLRALGVPAASTNVPTTEPRTCAREGCSTVFRPTPRQLRDGYGKFCSRQCDHEAHRIHPKPDERVCARPGCGTRFTPTGANVAAGWGRYCTKRCSALSSYERGKKKGRIVACDCCGRDVGWRYDSQIKQSGLHFCGDRTCWANYRWKHDIGISRDTVGFFTPSGRQKLGRLHGHKGAAAGIDAGRAKGGRKRRWLHGQQQAVLDLDQQGKSTRDIAVAVFGDARYKDRVARFLRA